MEIVTRAAMQRRNTFTQTENSANLNRSIKYQFWHITWATCHIHSDKLGSQSVQRYFGAHETMGWSTTQIQYYACRNAIGFNWKSFGNNGAKNSVIRTQRNCAHDILWKKQKKRKSNHHHHHQSIGQQSTNRLIKYSHRSTTKCSKHHLHVTIHYTNENEVPETMRRSDAGRTGSGEVASLHIQHTTYYRLQWPVNDWHKYK